MPNGGSDCCGTCPFNRKNHGVAGYNHSRDEGPDHCEIRDLPIEHAFYTYCANHTGHNPTRLRTPIGPVYRHGENSSRVFWQPPPVTEECRREVFRLLVTATSEPIVDYPAGLSLVEAAITHAATLGGAEFLPELDRIRQFKSQEPELSERRPFARDPGRSAARAAFSLNRLLPAETIRAAVNDTVRAVAATVAQTDDRVGLAILADAMQEAGCEHAATLEYLRSPTAGVPNWVVDVIVCRVGV